jgi:hypothetical protein
MGPTEGSSLHMTVATVAAAMRVAPDGHPWIEGAAAFARERALAADRLGAYETNYVLDFADASGDEELLRHAAARIPEDGHLPVQGGVEGEALSPLHLAPRPDHAARRVLPSDTLEADLAKLESGQHDDGGFDVDFLHWNPLVAWEWRGRHTVDVLHILRANGRL